MKTKLLLYCTKAKPYLTRNDLPNERGEFYKHWQLGGELDRKHLYGDTPILNGKIVAECDFEVEEIRYVEYADEWGYETNTLIEDDLIEKSCLSSKQLFDYLKHCKNGGYAIHIKNLHIFDEPKELKEYDDEMANPLNKAPQNMMYAFKYFANLTGIKNQFQEYVLISIQPQWMCLILNRIKDVEVRKKVLKEMLK